MSSQVIARPAPPSEPEKSTQKAIQKRIVDLLGPYVKLLQNRLTLQGQRTSPWLQPTMAGALQMLPPQAYPDHPISGITNKFVHACQNRTRCAVNCVNWTPEGRRCMTGDNIGQLTLWSSSDFKFEQLFQAHDKGLRHVTFTHNASFLFSCDDTGVVRIFKSNLAPLQKMVAHQEACRAVAIAPSDVKFVTCSDDQSVKVWDLATCVVEKTFTGHGSDVKFVDWHPTSSLLASSGRDGLIKLWDARQEPDAAGLTTLHGHKGPVNQVKWNMNGSWLVSASRDQSLRVWDIRHVKKELNIWQGHSREVYSVAWHPVHLELLASGAGDGNLLFWMVGQGQAVAKVEGAHEGAVLGVAFHPSGHMLASCAMEANTKMWVRQRPADPWRDALQKEQEEASTYAELLASAATAGTAAAAGPQGPTGMGVMGQAGTGQLPGGIAVQLPGLGGAGGGIPGIGVPAARPPPGLAPPRPPSMPPPAGAGGPAAAAAAAAVAAAGPPGMMPAGPPGGPLPPGLVPGGVAGLPLMQGMAAMGVPSVAGMPGLGRGLPGIPGVPQLPAAMGAGRGGIRPQGLQQHQQQQRRGFKRPRESDAASYTGDRQHHQQQQHHHHQQQHQQQHAPPGGFGGRGLGGRGLGGTGSTQPQQQHYGAQGPHHHALGGRGRGQQQQQQQQPLHGGMYQPHVAPPGQHHAGQQQMHSGGFQGRGGPVGGRGGYGRGFGRGFGGAGQTGGPQGQAGRGYGRGRGR